MENRLPRRIITSKAALVVALAIFMVPVTQVLAQEQGSSPSGEALNQLTGKDLHLSGEAAPVADETDDGVNRSGDPLAMAEGTDITEADWHEVDSALDPNALDSACTEGLETSGGQVDVICPENTDELKSADRFIMVEARFTGPITAETLSQFVFLWAEEELETYQGAAGEPNNDATDSIDLFHFSPTDPYRLGRTTFRGGAFAFDPSFLNALALMGQGFVVFLVVHDSLAAECLNAAVAAISGNAIDKASLPPTPSGTYTDAVEELEPTTTTAVVVDEEQEEESEDETEQESAATEEPQVDPTPIAAEPESGGINPAVWISVLVVALGGGVAYWLFTRNSGGCDEELSALTEAKTRLERSERDVAETRSRIADAETAASEAGGDPGRSARAAPNLTALRNDLADAEATASRDRESVEGWQYAYDLCMGTVEPRGAGVSDVPETPSSQPMTVVDSPPPAAAAIEESSVTSQPPPVASPESKVVEGAGVVGAMVGGAVAGSDCTDNAVEWRADKTVADIWEEPAGTINITIDNAPAEFAQWVQSHRVVPIDEEEAPDPTVIDTTLSLDDVGDLRDIGKAQALLRTQNIRHEMQLRVVVAQHQVGRHCERKWLCVDGKWVKTDETRLSQKEIVGTDMAPYLFEQTCKSGNQVATALNNALRNVTKMEEAADEKDQALRKKCAGGS